MLAVPLLSPCWLNPDLLAHAVWTMTYSPMLTETWPTWPCWLYPYSLPADWTMTYSSMLTKPWLLAHADWNLTYLTMLAVPLLSPLTEPWPTRPCWLNHDLPHRNLIYLSLYLPLTLFYFSVSGGSAQPHTTLPGSNPPVKSVHSRTRFK
jgi:hypothetical protein